MSKIEEILDKHLQFSSIRSLQIEGMSVEAMKEFGKICFEASRGLCSNTLTPKFINYEDFLKEIEDE